MRRVAVILNQHAGAVNALGPDGLPERIRQGFASHGVEADIKVAAGSGTVKAAQEAAAAHPDAVVAAGGDGTISSVASTLAGTDLPLGVLPLGTLNHFARDLKIPGDLDSAIELIVRGQPYAVDVGEVNGHFFLNNSSLGTYPQVVEERNRHRLGKRLALILAALKVVFRRPLVHVRLEFDGAATVRTTPFVFIGNNIYHLQLFSEELRARLDGGKLCVFAARCAGVGCLLRLGLRALVGRLQNSKEFDHWCVEQLRVDTHKPRARVALDGEVFRLESPLIFRVHRGALKVLGASGA